MRSSFARIASSFCLAALAAGAALAGAAGDKGQPSQPVPRQTAVTPFRPLTANGGVPLVTVQFSGTAASSGDFLIDTGAWQCIMTERMAKKLGLKPHVARTHGVGNLDTAVDRDRDGNPREYVEVPEMQIGELRLKHVQFMLLHDEEFFHFPEEHVEGLIGGTLLSKFALASDFPRKQLTFVYPGSLAPGDLAGLGMADSASSPLTQMKGTIFYRGGVLDYAAYEYSVKMKLAKDGREYTDELFVDTGSPDTSLSHRAASALKLESEQTEAFSTMGEGTVYSGIATVPAASVGTLDLTNIKVSYPGYDTRTPPLFGEDILAFCSVVFDFPGAKLYVKPVLPPIAPEPAALPAKDRIDQDRLRQAVELPRIPYNAALAGAVTDKDEDGGERDVPLRIAALTKRMKGDASDAERYEKLGSIYWHDRQHEPARTAFAKAADLYRQQLQAKPNDSACLAKLARALSDAGQDDEAAKAAQQATTLGAEDPQTWLALGWVTHARSVLALTGVNRTVDISNADLSELRALLARLRKSPPSDAQVAQAQALAKEARASFDKAVSLAGTSARPYEERADFLADNALGIDVTLKGIQGELGNPNALLHTKEYVADLEAAADRLQNDPKALARVALFEAELPLYQGKSGIDGRDSRFFKSLPAPSRRAIQEKLDRLQELAHSSDVVLAAKASEQIGILQYAVQRDHVQAEKMLRQAALTDPTRSEAANALVALLTEDSRYGDIVTFLQQRLQKRDTALDRLQLARALDRLGKSVEGEAQAKAALQSAPDDFTTNVVYADLLLKNSAEDTVRRVTDADDCLDRAEKAMGHYVLPGQKAVYGDARAIFWGIWGDVAQAKETAQGVLDAQRTDAQARDILAAVLVGKAE